jgi:hypothetical protein
VAQGAAHPFALDAEEVTHASQFNSNAEAVADALYGTLEEAMYALEEFRRRKKVR